MDAELNQIFKTKFLVHSCLPIVQHDMHCIFGNVVFLIKI